MANRVTEFFKKNITLRRKCLWRSLVSMCGIFRCSEMILLLVSMSILSYYVHEHDEYNSVYAFCLSSSVIMIVYTAVLSTFHVFYAVPKTGHSYLHMISYQILSILLIVELMYVASIPSEQSLLANPANIVNCIMKLLVISIAIIDAYLEKINNHEFHFQTLTLPHIALTRFNLENIREFFSFLFHCENSDSGVDPSNLRRGQAFDPSLFVEYDRNEDMESQFINRSLFNLFNRQDSASGSEGREHELRDYAGGYVNTGFSMEHETQFGAETTGSLVYPQPLTHSHGTTDRPRQSLGSQAQRYPGEQRSASAQARSREPSMSESSRKSKRRRSRLQRDPSRRHGVIDPEQLQVLDISYGDSPTKDEGKPKMTIKGTENLSFDDDIPSTVRKAGRFQITRIKEDDFRKSIAASYGTFDKSNSSIALVHQPTGQLKTGSTSEAQSERAGQLSSEITDSRITLEVKGSDGPIAEQEESREHQNQMIHSSGEKTIITIEAKDEIRPVIQLQIQESSETSPQEREMSGEDINEPKNDVEESLQNVEECKETEKLETAISEERSNQEFKDPALEVLRKPEETEEPEISIQDLDSFSTNNSEKCIQKTSDQPDPKSETEITSMKSSKSKDSGIVTEDQSSESSASQEEPEKNQSQDKSTSETIETEIGLSKKSGNNESPNESRQIPMIVVSSEGCASSDQSKEAKEASQQAEKPEEN